MQDSNDDVLMKLANMTPEDFLTPEKFSTPLDSNAWNKIQYNKGLSIGRKAKEIHIACDSTWSARMLDGGYMSSYESVGYHANTKELLQGFLDSGAEIWIHRANNVKPTRIK
jgi:hypothetical protein